MDTLFGLIEKEIQEPDKAIFHNVRALPGNSPVLADVLNPVEAPGSG